MGKAFLSLWGAGACGVGASRRGAAIWGGLWGGCAHWLATLEDALALEPEHVSAYGLTLEEGTPLERDWSAGRLSLPEDDEQGTHVSGRHRLAAHGLEQYEISNYARPGFFSRHNMGYWTGADYLPGPGGHVHPGGPPLDRYARSGALAGRHRRRTSRP